MAILLLLQKQRQLEKLLDKVKVLYLTTSYPMQTNPASGIFVQRLVSHMPDWVDPLVITPDSQSGDPLQKENDNIKVNTFRYCLKKCQTIAHNPGGIPVALNNNKLLYLLLPIFLLSEFISTLFYSFNTQVIHANWSVNGFIASIVGILIRRPVVTTLRGEDITRANKYKIDKFILRYCINWSSRVVCVNHSYREWITDLFPGVARKLCTIENGVDQCFLNIGKNRAAGKRPNQKLRLITVGSLIKRKRIQDIIAAVIALRDPDISLTIAGHGPEFDELNRLVIDNQIQDQVTFIGSIQTNKLLSLLESHDAFVLSSESEGRPNVVMEAMAAGLPVVTTKLPGIVEFVAHNENGLLFDIGDSTRLRDLLNILKSNLELRTALGRSAYDYLVSHNMNWNNTANKYADLYQALLAKEQNN